jgi:hypothetical protein
MPALTPVKIYRGEPTQILAESTATIGALSPVYTVGAGKRLIIKYIRVTNLFTDEMGNINIKSGTSATASNGDYILRTASVQPGDTLIFDMNEILDAGEKIYLWQGASQVSVQISGIEVTL